MDLQKQDYPLMLARLQPSQAVKVLNDRIKHTKKLNADIADWLQERRRVEEQYSAGLKKLAARQLSDENTDLGVFSTPWQKIVSSIQTLAESHRALALNIEVDVERPLRDFATTNREMKTVPTMSGNLMSLAKDLEDANKAAKKLREKGGKASADKVANAASTVENAQGQWDSQAPYVFEQLQAADESRLNYLRDVLTQYQTHVIESVSSISSSAEDCLNALLNVQVADEIKTFVMKTSATHSSTQQETSIATSSRSEGQTSGPSTTLAPTASATQTDDGSSHRSSTAQDRFPERLPERFPERLPERTKTASSIGKSFGLKRLGTVINRRKSGLPYDHSAAEERKKSSSNLGPFKRKNKEKEARRHTEVQPTQSPDERRLSEATRPGSQSAPSIPSESVPPIKTNGTAEKESSTTRSGLGLVNGTEVPSSPKLQEPLQPTPSTSDRPVSGIDIAPKPDTDGEGFSIPPAANDPITQAEQEAALLNEGAQAQSQFKVDIRNAPIAEEDGDATAAMASVANTLRAQAAPRRSQGTIRGRRDRNTIIVPNEQTSTSLSTELAVSAPLSAPLPPASPSPSSTPPVPSTTSPSTQQSPFKFVHRSTLTADDPASSDTHSVRSGRSLNSSASATVRHPDMHEPGLNASIVETVSASFHDGAVTRASLIGEVAFVYNPQDFSAPFGTDTIRLNNFTELEKVAPNPQFIEAVSDSPGLYTVNLSQATKTAVAFKYQVLLEEGALSAHSPLVLKPVWKVEQNQASVMLTYGLNDAFIKLMGADKTSLTLNNTIVVIHLDPTGPKATSCKAMGGGTFSRGRNLVYWRLGDITLSKDGSPQNLRARFFTDGEAKSGNIEARWEMHGEHVNGRGSGLSVSVMEHGAVGAEIDPFADEDAAPVPTFSWKDVRTVKSLRSGTYMAT